MAIWDNVLRNTPYGKKKKAESERNLEDSYRKHRVYHSPVSRQILEVMVKVLTAKEGYFVSEGNVVDRKSLHEHICSGGVYVAVTPSWVVITDKTYNTDYRTYFYEYNFESNGYKKLEVSQAMHALYAYLYDNIPRFLPSDYVFTEISLTKLGTMAAIKNSGGFVIFKITGPEIHKPEPTLKDW